MIMLEGDILGSFRDVYFGNQEIRVNRGDRFILYSDGLIENPEEKKVWTDGLDELLQACDQLWNVPISQVANGLFNLLSGNREKMDDDIVVMAIEI